MANKKGFEMQFNWLFILIAGVAILLFFTFVVFKQKSISETSIKASVLKSIEPIIIGAAVSTDTSNIVSIPKSDIELGCDRISLGGISKQYQNLILFGPSVIKGDKLVTQTLSFSVPYRATNLLYMTSPQLRYVIIGDSTLANDINKSLPTYIRKEFYQSLPEIKNDNSYNVRFVVFGEMIEFPKNLEKLPDSDISAVRIMGDSDKGKVEFYQKEGNSWLSKGSSVYLGKQSLIGAVYSGNFELYECNMQHVFQKLNLVTKIYSERTKKLIEKEVLSGRQSQCIVFYNTALGDLNAIHSASTNFGKTNIEVISSSAKSLADQNKNVQLYSCASIY